MHDQVSQTLAGKVHLTQRRVIVQTALLAAVWSILIFAVQEYTTGPDYPLPIAKAIGGRTIRFVLDLLALGSIAFLLRGWPIYALTIVGALPPVVLIVYYEYFGRALSLTTMANHFAEGLTAGDFALELVRWPVLLLVVSGTALLFVLARRANGSALPLRRRFGIAATCGMAYLIVALASTLIIDPVSKLRTFASVDRLAMTHGYVLTWLGEWQHLDGDALYARSLEAARITQDRLTALESSITLSGHLVIIQVESLDDRVVDLVVEKGPVMPFLRDLSHTAMTYRITPIHRSGSCDADFAMLMNLNPSGDVSPYAVPGFDWTPSIAALAGRGGRRSVFFHGNDGDFFNRGPAIDQMGFDSVLFRDDLVAQFGVVPENWGVSDRDVLAISRQLLNRASGRVLHFIISLTSHGPYHFLDSSEWAVFPDASSTREHYLNSMRYVDSHLKTYVTSLPDETVVVIYGDHTSSVNYGPKDSREKELVPFLVHQVGRNLSEIQRTRHDPIASSGKLTTLDAAGYVWSLLRSKSSN